MSAPPRLPTPSRRSLHAGALGLAVAGALGLCLPWRWLDAAENISLDLRIRLRAALAPDLEPAGAIVGVTDSSFSLAARAPQLVAQDPVLRFVQPDWPWDRRVFAATVRRLREAGARLIVFDIIFARQAEGDDALAEAIAEPGAPVVLASLWQTATSLAGENTAALLEPTPALLAVAGDRVGFANVWTDDDGVLRQATTAVSAADLLGLPASDPSAGPSLALAAARQLQPDIVAPSRGYIDYRETPDRLPLVPIEDLFLTDRWQGPWLNHGELFRNRVVWVGPWSEVRFKDVHQTPIGRRPGVEAQAQALSTLLHHDVLPPLAHAWQVAAVLGLAAAGLGSTRHSRRTRVHLNLAAGGALGWVALSIAGYVWLHTLVPLVAPTLAWLGASGSGLAVQLATERRERRRLRATLGRYVSEEVAQLIADQPDDFSHALRGERREVAVLFADLRGFTSWIEHAEPEAFIAQLNAYFTAIVDCVLEHGGTLQKFIGDAVLAAWGDTRTASAESDCRQAVAAALAMQAALENLNAGWREQGQPPLRIGIGLHHGTVMVGNVGHPRRLEFTVMGDAVNVAARLESANRQLETEILVSRTVRTAAAAHFTFLPVGPVQLKGRREPVAIYLPLASEPVADWLAPALAAQEAWERDDPATARARWAEAAAFGGPLTPYFHFRRTLAPPAVAGGGLVLETK